MDVLIVDDERTFAELLAERLRLRGYAVRVAGTAEAALEQMEDALPSGVAMAAWASSCGDFAVFHECLGFPENPKTQNRLCSCSPLAFPEQMCPGAQP